MAVSRYGKKVWQSGEVISAQKLNAISSALEQVTGEIVDDRSILVSTEPETTIKNNYPNNKIWYDPNSNILKMKDPATNNYLNVSTNEELLINELSTINSISSNTGSVAINSSMNKKLNKITFFLDPKQDLHGYSYAWGAGQNVNSLPMEISDLKNANTAGTWENNIYTYNGVIYELLINEYNIITGIHVKGKATANSSFKIGTTTWSNINSANYTLTGCPSGGGVVSYYLAIGADAFSDVLIKDAGSIIANYKYTTTATTYSAWIGVYAETNVPYGTIFQPMFIQKDTSARLEYRPSENVCPINGYDTFNAYYKGKNLLNPDNIIDGLWSSDSIYGVHISNFPNRKCFQITLPPGTYTLSATKSGVTISNYYIDNIKTNSSAISLPFTFDLSKASNVKFSLYYATGYTTSDWDSSINLQLEVNNHATDYVPYTSATNALTINVKQINNNHTVYGGTLTIQEDGTSTLIVNKELESLAGKSFSEIQTKTFYSDNTKNYITCNTNKSILANSYIIANNFKSTNFSHTGEQWICAPNSENNTNELAFFGTSTSTKQDILNKLTNTVICYELATPITYNLTAQQLELILGENCISSNTSRINAQYYIPKYLQNRIPIKQGSAYGAVIENAVFLDNQEINFASGKYSHAEGYATKAMGKYSHAEGENTRAEGRSAHSEGGQTNAEGNDAHAEGSSTTASTNAHAEGAYTTATGWYSHTEGYNTTTSSYAYRGHAEGYYTTANARSQHVFGEYNIIDDRIDFIPIADRAPQEKGYYIEIVGNGTSRTPSNARTLNWRGDETLAGDLILGTNGTNIINLSADNLQLLIYLLNVLNSHKIPNLTITEVIDRLVLMLEHWNGGEFGDNSQNYGTSHNIPLPHYAPITFSRQPADVTVAAGKSARFTATSEEVSSSEIMWQYSTDNGKTWIDAERTAGAIYIINPTTMAMNGRKVRALMSTKWGLAYTNIATLTVVQPGSQDDPTTPTNPDDPTSPVSHDGWSTAGGSSNAAAPTFTVQPKDRKVQAGKLTVIEGDVENADSYQWQYSPDNGTTWYNCGSTFTGPKTTRVLFAAKEQMNNWLFCLVATNQNGYAYSRYSLVTVLPAAQS